MNLVELDRTPKFNSGDIIIREDFKMVLGRMSKYEKKFLIVENSNKTFALVNLTKCNFEDGYENLTKKEIEEIIKKSVKHIHADKLVLKRF